MATESQHPDVEFVVSADGAEQTFTTFADALTFAFSIALSEAEVNLDVLVYSEEGATAFGGDSAVDEYREDPEASIFQRFEIEVRGIGRVP